MERTKYHCSLKANATAVEVAKKFLWAEGYTSSHGYDIVYYRGNFYCYHGSHYKELSRDSLTLQVISFLQDQKEMMAKATSHFVKNVILNIGAFTRIPDELEPSTIIGSANRKKLIGMKNGIFDLDKYLRGKNPLSPHTPKFFSFYCLPYKYSPNASCPRWEQILMEVLPEIDLRILLQEWIGYNLTSDTGFQKFVLLVGAGANGKSIICKVMRLILGAENISAVSLEQFNSSRTFPLAAMIGKVANIVEEIGDVDKVAEDILKNIVAGGEMTIERKNKDPFLAKFSAKLTFATNVVPRFRDRSEGTWRRIIFLPFTVQILDPRKQNRNFVDDSWWIDSGELEGVMNWALKGLARLKTRGFFIEPQASVLLKEDYKSEANPAGTFLSENYQIRQAGNTCSQDLYRQYSKAIKDQGGTPLGKPLFTREVKRAFPLAKLSSNARVSKTVTGTKSRFRIWENIGQKRQRPIA